MKKTGLSGPVRYLSALAMVCSAGCGEQRGDHPQNNVATGHMVDVATASHRSVMPEDGRDEAASPPHPAELTDPELESSSQQQPFDSDLWIGEGWLFDETAMASIAGTPATATFRRPYTKLMLQTAVTALDDGGEFAIHLFAPQTGCGLTLALQSNELVVTVDRTAAEPVVLHTRELAPSLQSGESHDLRVTATGNRLQVIWNNRRLLLCDQPSEQSGHPLTISLLSRDAGFRIDQLRLEGE